MLSIITPVLDGAKFIEGNIKAIMSLDLDYEHIVVDGGSKDDTLKILSKYPHIKVLNQAERSGMYGAIHQGFLEATGRYFAYVNCDDLVIKEGFELMYQTISQKDEINFVYANALMNYIEENRIDKMLAKANASFFLKRGIMPFVQPSSIYSSELYFKIGGLRYDTFRLAGDIDMFQRMVHAGEVPYRVSEFATKFLKYSGSLAAVNRDKMKAEKLKLNYPPSGSDLLMKILFKLKS